MLRLVLGVVVGLLVGVVVIAAVEAMGHMLFPPPADTNLTDPVAVRGVMAHLPLEAKIFVLIAWFQGVLAGAASAALIAGRRALAGRITAGILAALVVWTLVSIPHPAWMVAGAAVGTVIATLLADLAFGRRRA